MPSVVAEPEDCELAANGVCDLVAGVLWVNGIVPLEMGVIMSTCLSYRQNVSPFLSGLSTSSNNRLEL